ncbi:adaptin N terminal region-domain-containing protein [Gorgonomyces haynaldii]|nr:adaptin N terminal region-domain-containing protein [Gorgonomyces haynaldii]
MFEKSATDLIRGIRLNKKRQDEYVKQQLQEIQQEILKSDLDIKAQAVQKLTILHTMGYSMSWADFHVVQVMASPKFQHKRIGYYAAALAFRQDTDVIMLVTNLIKKDLSSNNPKDAILAMHCLAHIVTVGLARDLHQDVMIRLNGSQPYIRKRAIVCMYKIFLKYPDALRIAFPRLKEKLDETEPTVVQSAVNVICELARKNPKAYLPLAPQLFHLMTNSKNNWMIIKLVKLFASMTPLEPRLSKKLASPLLHLIQTTPAISVMYECVHSVIVGNMIPPEGSEESEQPVFAELLDICLSKLSMLIQENDQNLKYLGLVSLVELLKTRPKAVQDHRDIVFKCLEDGDSTIRARALDIIYGMVDASNIFGIVKHLLVHLASSLTSDTNAPSEEIQDRTLVARKIVQACSKDTFVNITNFEWYITVLVDLGYCKNVVIGPLIRDQLIDVCSRVREVRPFAVQAMCKLIVERELYKTLSKENNQIDILTGAAWICGEYPQFIPDPQELINHLLDNAGLKPEILYYFVSSMFKVYCHWASTTPPSLMSTTLEWITQLERLLSHEDLEVQQRTFMTVQLIKSCVHLSESDFLSVAKSFFEQEFLPVAPTSQKRVPQPQIDLATPLRKIEKQAEKQDKLGGFFEEIPIQKLQLDVPLEVDPVDAPRLSSVLQRPEAKKYDIVRDVELAPLESEIKPEIEPVLDSIAKVPKVKKEKTKKEKKEKKQKKSKEKKADGQQVEEKVDTISEKVAETVEWVLLLKEADFELLYQWRLVESQISIVLQLSTNADFGNFDLQCVYAAHRGHLEWTMTIPAEVSFTCVPIQLTLTSGHQVPKITLGASHPTATSSPSGHV